MRAFPQKNLLRTSDNVKSENLELLNTGLVVVDVTYSEVGDQVDDALDGFQMLLPRRGSNVGSESWFCCGCAG